MATTWTGWTLSEIVDQLKGLFGPGWALDSNISARVDRAVYSAWCAALAKMGEASTTTYEPADATTQPTAFNQYFGALAMFRAGLVIEPLSRTTELLAREVAWLEPQVRESDAIHQYYTA